MSPMFGPGSASLLGGLGKSASPHHGPLPPPLVPSSATAGRSHDNSPSSSSKLGKGCSPADSTTDLKDKARSSSTDPDTHSRVLNSQPACQNGFIDRGPRQTDRPTENEVKSVQLYPDPAQASAAEDKTRFHFFPRQNLAMTWQARP
ncbi:hypothetical protein ElyMa_000042900 [Elysia marginata]|uniref:Uncharacterized protein n=1 Tax=Elysia marginata TaxID=1093978 RepID=A0AAV4EE25_9GAST|nr:hypothetical protein ElyMa_000042900 [Elysia marginata]